MLRPAPAVPVTAPPARKSPTVQQRPARTAQEGGRQTRWRSAPPASGLRSARATRRLARVRERNAGNQWQAHAHLPSVSPFAFTASLVHQQMNTSTEARMLQAAEQPGLRPSGGNCRDRPQKRQLQAVPARSRPPTPRRAGHPPGLALLYAAGRPPARAGPTRDDGSTGGASRPCIVGPAAASQRDAGHPQGVALLYTPVPCRLRSRPCIVGPPLAGGLLRRHGPLASRATRAGQAGHPRRRPPARGGPTIYASPV